MLSAAQRDQLDSLPSLEELTLSLASLPTGKSPGLDGLPVEFYKSFWSLLCPEILEVFTSSLQCGELPMSCRRAVISLLPKKEDPQLIGNWSPMSLLTSTIKYFL